MVEGFKTEADEQRDQDLADEIAENKLDPWCQRCHFQMSIQRHRPPTMTHYFEWSEELNKIPAPEGGDDRSRDGFYE